MNENMPTAKVVLKLSVAGVIPGRSPTRLLMSTKVNIEAKR